MRWWKRKLAESQPGAEEAADALAASEASLAHAESLAPQVESVTRSLDVTRTNNHFAMRIAAAYGLAHPGGTDK